MNHNHPQFLFCNFEVIGNGMEQGECHLELEWKTRILYIHGNLVEERIEVEVYYDYEYVID
jgi:hypothetical protein